MRDEHIPIRTPEQAIETINKLNNHSASPTKLIKEDLSSNTMRGITKYFNK